MTYGDLTPGQKIEDSYHGTLTFARRSLSNIGESLYRFYFAEGVRFERYLDMEVTPA